MNPLEDGAHKVIISLLWNLNGLTSETFIEKAGHLSIFVCAVGVTNFIKNERNKVFYFGSKDYEDFKPAEVWRKLGQMTSSSTAAANSITSSSFFFFLFFLVPFASKV